MASPEEQVLHNPHLVLSILRYVTPADLLRVQRVSCIFRQAASHTTWNGHLAATFGHSSQRPQGSFKDMITLDGVTGLSGWCEDHCTANGATYTMDIHGIEATRNRGSRKISAVRQRILEGCTRWAYALPTPRTRVKLALLPVGLEVWSRGDPMPVATARLGHASVPLYSRRVAMTEYAKLPGSGPVDVPTQYWGFRVGPAILGCFLPPQAPLFILQLKTHDQKLGTFILWPKDKQLPPNSSLGVRDSSEGEIIRIERVSYTGSSTSDSSTDQTVNTMQQDEGASSRKAGATTGAPRVNVAAAPAGPSDAPAAAVGDVACAAAAACQWLGWRAWSVGCELSGTVLTNFLVSSVTGGPRAGNAMLGVAQAWVTQVTPLPKPNPSSPTVTRVHLLLHLPAREWVIDANGVPVPVEPHEASYTAAITCPAAIDIHEDGKVEPVPLPVLAQPIPAPEQLAGGWEAPAPPAPAAATAGDGAARSGGGGGDVCAMCGVGGEGEGAAAAAAAAAAVGQLPQWMQRLRAVTVLPAAMDGASQAADQEMAVRMKVVLAAALQLSKASNAAHPYLVDRWPAQLQGRVAGNILMAMVSHPVVGRAVLCVSADGLASLAPQFP